MHLARLKLRDFRNYARLDAAFEPGFHVLLGDNAHGKTNLLEAIYLLATLRSFRGVTGAQMVRQGQKGLFVAAQAVGQAAHSIKYYWAPGDRRLSLNNMPVRRLSHYFGVLRAVVFCSEDTQLVKGASTARRRFLDFVLAQTQPGYLEKLQRYASAIRSRNALLKPAHTDDAALEVFTGQMLEAGNALMASRSQLMPRLLPFAQTAYQSISVQAEVLTLDYRPSVKEDFAVELRQSRARERMYRTTVVGPHRDDLALGLNHQPAAQFASEGQKRSIALALKMAQAEFLAAAHGTAPILLIDDVMGELDAKRRQGFLPLLERAHHDRSQVFMTCTEQNWPRDLALKMNQWTVTCGSIRPHRRENSANGIAH